jgi:hypothetical protein
MDWLNEAWAQATQFGISGGTLGLLAWNTFVSSRLGNKRVDNLLNFTGLAHKTFKDVGALVETQLSSFRTEMIDKYLKPTQAQLENEKEEKVFWQNIAVSALAVANVPLNQKESMFAMAQKATSISNEATKVLEQSIANDKLKAQQATITNDTLNDEIDKV